MDHRPDLYIDFDDTIHDTKNVSEGHKMGQPTAGAVNAVRYLSRSYRIIVFTVRGDQPYIKDWLRHFNIPFDAVTNVKGPAVAYVDDKAVHFDGNWNRVIQEVQSGR